MESNPQVLETKVICKIKREYEVEFYNVHVTVGPFCWAFCAGSRDAQGASISITREFQ